MRITASISASLRPITKGPNVPTAVVTTTTTTTGGSTSTVAGGDSVVADSSATGGGVETTQAEKSPVNAALIDGIVGGVAGLLVLGGIAAAIVFRRRARADNVVSSGEYPSSRSSVMETDDVPQLYSEPSDVRLGNTHALY